LAKVYEDSLATIVSLYDAAGVEAVKDPKLNLEVGYALINMLDSEGSVIISFLAAIEDWKVRYKVPAEYQDEYEQASAIQATFYIIGATGTLEERGVVVSVKKVVGNKGPTKVDTLTTKLAANVSDSVMAGTKFDFRRVDDFKPLEFKPDSLFKDDHVQIVMSCDTGVVLKTQKQIAAAKLDMFENEKNRAYYAELMQNFSFNILANPIISLAYNDFREGNITIGNVVGMDLENNAYMLCNSIYKNSSWNDVKGYADAVAVADPLAASLVHSRKYHTASLLSSGKVLIAGGSGVAGNLSAAEIYDPGTELFLMDPAAAAILVEKQTAAVEKARAAEAAAAAVEEARAAEAAAAAAAAAVYVPALREYVAMAKKKALQLRSNAANVAMEAEKNPELWNKAKQLAEAAVEAAELWAVKAQELLQSTLEIANRAANDGSDAEVAAAKKAVEESEVGVMEASENMELAYIALEKAKNAYFSVGGGGE